jgi:hypothetical protein
MNLPRICCLLASGLVMLSAISCSPYATVREVKPKVEGATFAGQMIKRALGRPEKTPEAQIGHYLDAAALAAGTMKVQPENDEARRAYNFAIGRIFDVVDDAKLEPWKAPVSCPGAEAVWSFSLKAHHHGGYEPSYFQIRPADRYEFGGRLVTQRTVKEGVGAPMVVKSQGVDFTQKDPFIMGKTVYYGMTVLLDFRGRECIATYYDPLRLETVPFGGRSVPLAADFTAPIALALAELKPRKAEIERLVRPDHFAGTSRLARLQPYEENKIPILCIHGLGDSQATWAPLIETLRGDATIRQNYQFWFYTYPTGYPYPLMAADLRKQLDLMRKAHPGHKKFVVIGHSMGGMIARELITDSGMKIWNAYFDLPPDRLPVAPEARQVLERALIFNHRADVSRVIFTSASLGGSDVAVGFMGKLGRRLIGSSSSVLGSFDDTMKAVSHAKPGATGAPIVAMPNSIDALDPENRFILTINRIPPVKGIPYHSIIADRGKGGNLDKTKPVSTDGLVPYWSSHIDGAESEIIVPSGHWSNQHPLAIAEVRRILLLHLGKK